jgi:hypothetical protein
MSETMSINTKTAARDEAFEKFYTDALAKGWSDDNARRYDSRLVWRVAWAIRGAADVAAVEGVEPGHSHPQRQIVLTAIRALDDDAMKEER